MKLNVKFILLTIGIILFPLLIVSVIGFLRYNTVYKTHPVHYYLQIKEWLENSSGENCSNLEDEAPPPEGVELLLLDENNTVIYSSFTEYIAGEKVVPGEILNILAETHPDYTFYFEPFIEDGDVKNIVLIGAARFSQEHMVESQIEKGIIIFLGLFILSSILGGFFINHHRRAITTLEAATKQISAGNLDFQLKAKGKDEIASLTNSFDSMREKLKAELDKRSRFLMAVSHDLKTPLTAIEGYLEAISDGFAEKPEVLEKYIKIMMDKSKLLEERILELVDYVRLETGEWAMKHEEINIKDFLSSIALMYAEDIQVFKRQFDFSLNLPENVKVSGDRGLLNRAFENLFNNAIRYTQEGDSIYFKAFLNNSTLEIILSDTGPGIGQEDLKHIFQPFYRGTNSRRESGTGLGLSTVKSIMNAHGWEISACSETKKGMEIKIEIGV
jgi:signal transduction histidine kinase